MPELEVILSHGNCLEETVSCVQFVFAACKLVLLLHDFYTASLMMKLTAGAGYAKVLFSCHCY